jgi:hypothetical protein
MSFRVFIPLLPSDCVPRRSGFLAGPSSGPQSMIPGGCQALRRSLLPDLSFESIGTDDVTFRGAIVSGFPNRGRKPVVWCEAGSVASQGLVF